MLAIFLTNPFGSLASASGVPENGVLAFDIVRNGDAIGTHTYRFNRSGNRTEVSIRTDIDFRLLFIPVYRFEHESREVWENGLLLSLESQTNENGSPVKLQVVQDENSLMVKGEDRNLRVDREIIPASLWNRLVLERAETLTTISGSLKKFEVEFIGEKTIEIHGDEFLSQHFRLTGEFEREIWYDANDVLIRAQFEASDGSTVEYVLK
tara:strand:+ start:300 stop:926 length:627 start_codon:yes stop_codon:yes gene_type:complete